MDMLNKPVTIHAGASCITLGILTQVMALSCLHWRAHPAQIAAIEMNLFVVESDVSVKADGKELGPKLPITLFGIPVSVDESCVMSQILLMRGDEVVVKIEQLAIPTCFMQAAEEQENAT